MPGRWRLLRCCRLLAAHVLLLLQLQLARCDWLRLKRHVVIILCAHLLPLV